MKQFTIIIKKIKDIVTSREYLIYTGIFTGLLLGLYFYNLYSGANAQPEFTYAEFRYTSIAGKDESKIPVCEYRVKNRSRVLVASTTEKMEA